MREFRLRPSAIVWALVVYALLLSLALLAPTSGTQSGLAHEVVILGRALGVPHRLVNRQRAPFLCNVLILMPMTALCSLRWPTLTWRDWTTTSFLLASGVEAVQGLLLPQRTASATDIVANTLGGLGGAIIVAAVRAILRRRDRHATTIG